MVKTNSRPQSLLPFRVRRHYLDTQDSSGFPIHREFPGPLPLPGGGPTPSMPLRFPAVGDFPVHQDPAQITHLVYYRHLVVVSFPWAAPKSLNPQAIQAGNWVMIKKSIGTGSTQAAGQSIGKLTLDGLKRLVLSIWKATVFSRLPGPMASGLLAEIKSDSHASAATPGGWDSIWGNPPLRADI